MRKLRVHPILTASGVRCWVGFTGFRLEPPQRVCLIDYSAKSNEPYSTPHAPERHSVDGLPYGLLPNHVALPVSHCLTATKSPLATIIAAVHWSEVKSSPSNDCAPIRTTTSPAKYVGANCINVIISYVYLVKRPLWG